MRSFVPVLLLASAFLLAACGNEEQPPAPDPVCGNGSLEPGELCDDGNTADGDGCRPDCTKARCGDGVVDPGEECDSGGANSATAPNACRPGCVLPGCGDAVVDSGEGCDLGTANSDTTPGGCRKNCAPAGCGDGVVDSGEQCDLGDANSMAPDGCRPTCVPAWCGDGVVDSGEACDEGEANSDTVADACRKSCAPARCGDGVVDTGEQCDEGAANSDLAPNACRTNCASPRCGDGVRDTGEQCDQGAANSDTAANACRTSCRAAWCGDGVRDLGEQCDQGASNSNTVADACRTSCALPRCGDGVQDLGEECDEGVANSSAPDACRPTCDRAWCGDAVVDTGEQCDQGLSNSDLTADACRTNCASPRCGDGVRDTGEQCDQGASNSNTLADACRTSCVSPRCGDGVRDLGEQCDQGASNGNTLADACRTSCASPRCGDGVRDTGEQCDQGASNSNTLGDACRTTCASPRCGDGVRDTGEQCDQGASNSNTLADACRTTCVSARCGDGVRDTGEQCDDGNSTAGDGCENDCSATFVPVCGNGTVEAGEACDDGNTVPGDGCENDCTETPISSGPCAVTAGSATLLVKGDLLLPGQILAGGQLVVGTDGLIKCVGADCTGYAAGATVLDCRNSVVSPGLINGHDHLTFANNEPYVAATPELARERYDHRHDWRMGKRGHTKISSVGGATSLAIAGSELRFVMGGATSTVSSGAGPGLLRNLDRSDSLLGLAQSPATYETFPLGDTAGELLASGCGYPSYSESSAEAYFPHVAEGIDDEAHNEFRCLESTDFGGRDLVKSNAAFIHGVGALPPDAAWMALDGAKLVWSPRTNISLYGDTAPVTLYARAGATIALGTDWVRSGSTNMLRELKCAADLNETYFGGFFSDEDLWRMATVNAARAAAMDDGAGIGTLAVGKVADLALFRKKSGRVGYRAVIDAEPADVALVLRGGKALYGDATVVAAIPAVGGCEVLDVCGVSKSACVGETASSLSAIKTEAEKYSPLFACAGAPPKEPTCQPARSRPEDSLNGSTVYDGIPTAEDHDGDGIPNVADNCPAVFNPIRPMDGGQQADFDRDGAGDVCDVCPISADDVNCPAVTPGDYDRDGIEDWQDNCVQVPNADQSNRDGDLRGDACDSCQDVADPCPPDAATIYLIKTGAVANGANVSVSGVVVTGVDSKGFFVQIPTTAPYYAGPDYSGLYVYLGAMPAVVRGDLVTVSGTVADYFGQKQLGSPTTVVISSGEPLPAAVVVQPSEISTGASRSVPLEGVLVKVVDVKVTNANPDYPGVYNEFEVSPKAGGAGVRVNDLIYRPASAPVVGDEYSSITGVLDWRNANSKIEPRDANDLVLSNPAPRLAGISPGYGYLRQGATNAATIPSPMKVRLVQPVASDTVVTVTSASGAIAPRSVTVPAGQTEAALLFDASSQVADTTVTASVPANSVYGTVRVLAAFEAPSVVTLSPQSAIVAPNSTLSLTATLDLPASSGGATVLLNVVPAGAGTAPASIYFAPNELSKSFQFTAGTTAQTVAVVATFGSSASQADLTIEGGPLPSGRLVIDELSTRYTTDAAVEFVELYNGTALAVDLTGYTLCYRSAGATSGSLKSLTWLTGSSIPPGKHFLIGTSGFAATVASDATFGGGLNDVGGSLWLARKTATCATGLADSDLADVVGWGTAIAGNFEGAAAAPSQDAASGEAAGKSIARKVTGVDSDDNAADFQVGTPNPQNLSSP